MYLNIENLIMKFFLNSNCKDINSIKTLGPVKWGAISYKLQNYFPSPSYGFLTNYFLV